MEIRMNRESLMRISQEIKRLTEIIQDQHELIRQQQGPTTGRTTTTATNNQDGRRIKMKRDIAMTVKDLWDEWAVGIDSNPPIRDLETNTRKKWRSGDKTENKYFERRKVSLIDAVQ
jgi:hypothetical protein